MARRCGGRRRWVEDFAELGGYYDMPVNTYSAGMRARLAFGACLAIDFDVYLIDEVTEIGDDAFRTQMRLARSASGCGAPTSSWSRITARTIRQYCDRAAVLADGRLFFHDNVRTAFDDYRSPGVMEAA